MIGSLALTVLAWAAFQLWCRANAFSVRFWYEYWHMPWLCLLEARQDPAWRLFAPWESAVEPTGHWLGGWIGPTAFRVNGETWVAYVQTDDAFASMERIGATVRGDRLALLEEQRRRRFYRLGLASGRVVSGLLNGTWGKSR